MNPWTTAADVRAVVQREWDCGRLLAARVPIPLDADGTGAGPGTTFPLRVRLRRPKAREVAERFEDVRRWALDVQAMPHARVERVDVPNRLLGTQSLPAAVWVDTPDQALAMIGRTRAAAAFDRLVAATPRRFHPVVAGKALRVADAAADWPAIVAAADWLLQNPQPGIYLRQADIAGGHTKVLEEHRRLIAALVDQVRPGGSPTSGHGWFERRYGFRTKPALVRFRQLDPDRSPLPGLSDVTLTIDDFAGLPVPVDRVFVTENEINFLSFPAVPGSLVIFGSGNEAPEALGAVGWLADVRIHYWGDIDTHGFAILDRFRMRLPRTRSLLMDMGTLLAHRDAWGREPVQLRRDLSTLTDGEARVYGSLLAGALGDQVRLEQEYIAYTHVLREVATVAGTTLDVVGNG